MPASPTLVIMAAGAARRYGGLKQLAPVGPAGQALMEYTIHDALQTGFGRVVLVVRQEFEASFREKFVDRATSNVDIAFAYQEPGAFVPSHVKTSERTKPWGTAHAVLCAKPHVVGPFAVVNADDFYGRQAIGKLSAFLVDCNDDNVAAMVGYELQNTLSDHGTVNRGVCRVNDGGWLTDISERFEIARQGDEATCRDADGNRLSLAINAIVSMNLWGFPATFLEQFELGFAEFLASNPDASTEFELPTFVKQSMATGALRVRVLPTEEKWCGMTYQDDLPATQARVARLVNEGVYPRDLW